MLKWKSNMKHLWDFSFDAAAKGVDKGSGVPIKDGMNV